MLDERERPLQLPWSGLGNTSYAASVDGPAIAPRIASSQAEISAGRRARPNLRLVPPPPPSRPRHRHLAVRISAADGRAPIGRSRAFKLSDHDLGALIALAMRLEGGP